MFAESLVEACGLQPVYLATAQAFDGEMASRIGLHQARRGPNWRTHEEPLELAQAIIANAVPGNVLLVDCLTLWVTNLMMAERDIDAAGSQLEAALGQASGPVVMVSNEVGLGIVPDNAMARAFRDHAGRINQRIAAASQSVFFVAAGLPLVLKS